MEPNEAAPQGDEDDSLRFEDLTVDDDLPLIERVVRYCRSGIALQRLVHVKMLAETAETVGNQPTLENLIPMFDYLVNDRESVIRQHVAAQILPVSLVAMTKNVGFGKQYSVQDLLDQPSLQKEYHEKGYKAVATNVVTYISTLVMDHDLDVRRAASDALAGLGLQMKAEDVQAYILPIPLKLVQRAAPRPGAAANAGKGGKGGANSEEDQLNEDFRITAANLLAELGGAAGSVSADHDQTLSTDVVEGSILPAVLALADDPSFRVRRSAAQALPRILGGSNLDIAKDKILPAFEKLSDDDLYRVRKSTGECLVDMSRSFMILASRETDDGRRKALHQLRRDRLIPIVERLIKDSSRLVRHGMMQFLGPFIASFYPYVDSALHAILPGTSESDGSNHTGIVAQFFPHASSMVSRLNSSAAATNSAPTPVAVNLEEILTRKVTDLQLLQQSLPSFIRASRLSSLSLKAVVTHRRNFPPPKEDVQAVVDVLLKFFADLASVTTGDDNTDAEMRVYCAYSYPAVALVLGPENWEGLFKTCFLKLLNPKYGETEGEDGGQGGAEGEDGENGGQGPTAPPLPVKRCLASSLHTVAHILGPELASKEVMPLFREYFLRDPDESVRLNVLRNFPSLLTLLQPEARVDYVEIWSEIVLGEEFLGTKKRSATNPLVLNWRQRDYLARSLPDLLLLVGPYLIRERVWPIVQTLLLDTVDLVRDDSIWAIAILLQAYCPANVDKWGEGGKKKINSSKWSAEACEEVTTWIKESVIRVINVTPVGSKGRKGNDGMNTIPANFSKRQLYCRICAAVGIAIRFGAEVIGGESAASSTSKMISIDKEDPLPGLIEKFKTQFGENDAKEFLETRGPYLSLSSQEIKHLKQCLVDDILPPALEMNDDRIINVRLALLKVLQLMPQDVKELDSCSLVLQGLVEEMETWESFDVNDEALPQVGGRGSAQNNGAPQQQQQQQQRGRPQRGEEAQLAKKKGDAKGSGASVSSSSSSKATEQTSSTADDSDSSSSDSGSEGEGAKKKKSKKGKSSGDDSSSSSSEDEAAKKSGNASAASLSAPADGDDSKPKKDKDKKDKDKDKDKKKEDKKKEKKEKKKEDKKKDKKEKKEKGKDGDKEKEKKDDKKEKKDKKKDKKEDKKDDKDKKKDKKDKKKDKKEG